MRPAFRGVRLGVWEWDHGFGEWRAGEHGNTVGTANSLAGRLLEVRFGSAGSRVFFLLNSSRDRATPLLTQTCADRGLGGPGPAARSLQRPRSRLHKDGSGDSGTQTRARRDAGRPGAARPPLASRRVCRRRPSPALSRPARRGLLRRRGVPWLTPARQPGS